MRDTAAPPPVLVLHADPSIARLTCAFLESAPLPVLQAVDVWDAVERLAAGELFSALILDLAVLSERSLVAALLGRGVGVGAPPVLGLTSMARVPPELRQRCAKVLRLPLLPLELLGALRGVVPGAPWSLPPADELAPEALAPEELPDVEGALRDELERLHEENLALTERLQRRQCQIDALGQVAELIHAGRPARAALAAALEAFVQLDRLSFAALFLEDAGAQLRCAASAGWPPHLAEELGLLLARRLSADPPARTTLVRGAQPGPLPLRRLHARRVGVAPIELSGERCGAVLIGLTDEGPEDALALARLDNARVWLGHAVAFTRSVRRLHRAQERLSAEANHDALTGLLNRRAFLVEAGDKLERLRGVNEPAALLFLDLDHFKQLNDRLGHEAGDEALCVVADTLLTSLRRQDLCARLGGDEFAALCIGVSQDYAAEVAASVRQAIRRALRGRYGPSSGLDISVGVAQLHADGEDLDALLRHADAAMYAAKRRQRRPAQGV